jgi:hypothetical protein
MNVRFWFEVQKEWDYYGNQKLIWEDNIKVDVTRVVLQSMDWSELFGDGERVDIFRQEGN